MPEPTISSPKSAAFPSPGSDTDPFAPLGKAAVSLAADLLKAARAKEGLREKSRMEKLMRMMDDPEGKKLMLALADRLFRLRDPKKSGELFRYLVHRHGIPKFLSPMERFLLGSAAKFAVAFPSMVMPLVNERLRREFSEFVLTATPEKLHSYLAQRKKAGFEVDLNLPGDGVPGEELATQRLDRLVALLQDPAVGSLSVKLSSILPQMDVFAFEESVAAARERLRRLYRAAMANPTVRQDGSRAPKFVCLDVDHSREMRLTAEAFRVALSDPEFSGLEAGIVLQAYLPEAHAEQAGLIEWSRARVEGGGAPIKIRLVKGGNLAMEKVDAAVRGWPQAPYLVKGDVDASFKRMLHRALLPENASVARLGVATHNIFDIAYALVLGRHHGTLERIDIEMLEGMANHVAKAVKKEAGRMILHTSIVPRSDFATAIAQICRRLDKKTSDGHFPRELFSLKPGTPAWESQKERFLRSCAERNRVATSPGANTDRSTPDGRKPACVGEGPFINEPPTDWASAANRAWIHDCLRRLREAAPEEVPLVIGGETIEGPYATNGQDPSRPGSPAYLHTMANEVHADQALQAARVAAPVWAACPVEERRAKLITAAGIMARERGETIAALVMDAGKSVPEADVEVSRAIDFANHSARAFDDNQSTCDVEARPLGTVVVASSWVTPYAGPAGHLLAALMAGNTVVLKPAPETVLAGWRLATHLWEAGIPKDVLQFVPAPDNHVGRSLVASEHCDAVLLTGSPDTARLFQGWKTQPYLHASTSGKNSVIITANADLERAIQDLLRSAFLRAGQECSAVSLAIVEAEVYDDPAFRRRLKDAAASLRVGSAWSPGAFATPLLHAPSKDLQRALFTNDPGEEWLLEPRTSGRGAFLAAPAIKLGVQPGSWFHRTLFYGPVLGLIRAQDFDEALRIQNDSIYGLTGGLHSLDEREIARWKEGVQVGNAYINLPTNGAIVRRQPFGGWKSSIIGPGAKSGGPNFVASLCRWNQQDLPTHPAELRPEVAEVLQTMCRWLKVDLEREVAGAAAASYQHFMNVEFGVEHNPDGVPGERHTFRYRPLPRGVLLRLREPFQPLFLAGAVLAAMTTGVKIELSLMRPSSFADALGLPVTVETEDELARRIEREAVRYDQLRVPQRTVTEVYRAAARHHLTVIDQEILANGRIELSHYFLEQTISESIQRHGYSISE